MVLAWLSNTWKSQRVDPQLFKFTKQFTYESNIENINTFFSKLSNYSYAKEAVNRVNQQRAFDLSFIDSEIKNLESITIPTPKFIDYMDMSRWKSKRSNRRRTTYVVNPQKYSIYQQQVAQFDIYKSDTLSRIASNLSFLGKQRDLIPSEPFSL